VDFDGDGILDLVSGSYDPGEIYLFRGLGKGQFAARETIVDKSGKPILRVPNQKERVESFGSWMAMVDWEDRGVLDIVVGTFDGMMFLRRNEGSRAKPAFAATNEWVHAGGKPLRVPGGAHANPVIADWDGDGLWDIITGSADGGVYWYRNVGKRGRPEFALPVALVAKHDGIGYSELLEPDRDPKPGIRSQIAVVDYDGNGKLDLLVGDFCTNLHIKKQLTPEQRGEFQSVRDRQAKASKQLGDSMGDLRKRYDEVMKDVPKSEWHTPENSKKWTQMYQEMRTSEAYKKHRSEYESLQKDLLQFVDGRGATMRDIPDVPHGYVWLFRRK